MYSECFLILLGTAVARSQFTEISTSTTAVSTSIANRNAMGLFFGGGLPQYIRAPVNSTVLSSLPQPYKSRYGMDSTDLSKRIGPVARTLQNFNSASLPCCRDRFGESSCQSLRKSQPAHFEKRCLSDHDFNTLDCCAECRRYIEQNNINPDNIRTIQKAPVVCKDKHSIAFCRRFKEAGMGKFSCKDTEFAIRVCRSSCGYCNDELYTNSMSVPLCGSTSAFNMN